MVKRGWGGSAQWVVSRCAKHEGGQNIKEEGLGADGEVDERPPHPSVCLCSSFV